MYTPHRYRVVGDEAIDAFVRAHGFAILVTAAGGRPTATHVPVELSRTEAGERFLEGHVAKANPQWRSWRAGERALVLFHGPHAYVSPTWYDHENVPTWNYQAVHLAGTLECVTEPAELLPMLRRLAEHYEPPGAPAPRFDVDAMTPKLRDAELLGIVGFRVRVDAVEASFKLSQNRDAANRANVAERLRATGEPGAAAVAEAMERLGSG